MTYQDKTLICRDCQQNFLFSGGEQEFFAQKNLMNEPKRCPNCRVTNRSVQRGDDVSQLTDIRCESCGRLTRVPLSQPE